MYYTTLSLCTQQLCARPRTSSLSILRQVRSEATMPSSPDVGSLLAQTWNGAADSRLECVSRLCASQLPLPWFFKSSRQSKVYVDRVLSFNG